MKVIITGVTGMVGEGVLRICLADPRIEEVLTISRKPSGYKHDKLRTVVVQDFFDLNLVKEHVAGYDACFFCLGISSVGVAKDEYDKVTYELTIHFAEMLSSVNKQLTFCYISGAGTSEKSVQHWAQVKAKTESKLQTLGFTRAFGVRPGFIKPLPQQKFAHRYYQYIGWLFPLGRRFFPKGFCSIEELAHAMMKLAEDGYSNNIIEGDDIIKLGAH